MKRYKYALLFTVAISAIICHANASENEEKSKEETKIDSTVIESDSTKYDYVLIERNGGGDKLFSISKGEGDYYTAYFARYNFKDTTFRIDLKTNDLGDTLSNTIENILLGDASLFETDTIANARGFVMGSWMKSYAIKDTIKTKITNRDLLSAIAAIERKVEQKINTSTTEK